MTATAIFWDYFQPIANALPGVQQVMLADGDRIDRLIAESVGTEIYPAVVSLRPKYRPVDNGADQYYAAFEVTFFVFCRSEINNDASQDAAYDQAEEMALAVLHQMRQDHRYRADVDFEYGSAKLEPVTMMTLDACQGYEVKCKLLLEASVVFS